MELISNFIEALKIIATVSIFFVWFIRYENIVQEFKKMLLDLAELRKIFDDILETFNIHMIFFHHISNYYYL